MIFLKTAREQELENRATTLSGELDAYKSVITQIASVFSVSYDAIEETELQFVVRRAKELEIENNLAHDALNELFQNYIIPAYQKLQLPCYHAFVDAEMGNLVSVNFGKVDHKEIRLRWYADSDSYIYWQNDENGCTVADKDVNYGCDYNFTPENVEKWLRWLVT